MANITNTLATAEQLFRRTSTSALPSELLDIILFTSQTLTSAAGLLLQLPQSITAQANILLARYWLIEGPMDHEFSDTSAAAIYLTAKLSAIPRSPRTISNVYAYILSRNSCLFLPRAVALQEHEPETYYLTDDAYYAFHTRVLAIEARMLYALSFDTHAALPHPLAITYLQTLDFLAHPREAISRRAVQYLNTALLSPQMLYLTHQPNALAVAAIYNAARDLGAKMPECEWWEVFDVDREELGFLVVGMRSLTGWVRQRREEMPQLEKGMVTRAMIKEELTKRGLAVGNGGTNGMEDDEESRMMREMDQKSALMEQGH